MHEVLISVRGDEQARRRPDVFISLLHRPVPAIHPTPQFLVLLARKPYILKPDCVVGATDPSFAESVHHVPHVNQKRYDDAHRVPL